MNNNTVVMDLKKYDEMTEELRTLKEAVKDILEELKSNLVLPRDGFFIEEEYGSIGDSLVLKINKETVKKIMADFTDYDYKNNYGDYIKINAYQLKITKKVVEVDEE